MEQELFTAIAQYQEDVFEYREAEMTASFLRLINALEHWANNIFREEDRASLNQVLEMMLSAYQHRDYLLVADLAEYELKPLAVQTENGRNSDVALC